jgi:hypothetical protein
MSSAAVKMEIVQATNDGLPSKAKYAGSCVHLETSRGAA